MAKKPSFAERVAAYERNPTYYYRTQAEIAQAMPEGFSVRTWQDWVTGRREPPAWVQVLVLEHLEKVLRQPRHFQRNED